MGSSLWNFSIAFGGAMNPFNTKYVASVRFIRRRSHVGANIATYGLGSVQAVLSSACKFCGIVGLKPDIRQCIPITVLSTCKLTWPMDLSQNVEDASIVLFTIPQYDEKDNTSKVMSAAQLGKLNNDIKIAMKIRYCREYLDGIRDDVKGQFSMPSKVYMNPRCRSSVFW